MTDKPWAALLTGSRQAGPAPVYHLEAVDQTGQPRQVAIPGESPLTIRVDGRDIATLMTLGSHPEELALGFLRSQRLLERLEDVASLEVDWAREAVEVRTRQGVGLPGWDEKASRLEVSGGCGQSSLFSRTLENLRQEKLPRVQLRQSTIYALLEAVTPLNVIYRQASSVHCCCLCQEERVLMAVEDVARHNAADIVAGRMWLEGITGADKIIYATCRLTAEIVTKVAFMGVPAVVTKSGMTRMGLELARNMGMVVIGRAETGRFLVFNGQDQVVFDALEG